QGVFHNFQSRDGQELTYSLRPRTGIYRRLRQLLAGPARLPTASRPSEDARLLTISYDNLQRLYREVREGERVRPPRGRGPVRGRTAPAHLVFDEETPPEQRYARFLATYPDLQQRIPAVLTSPPTLGVKPQSLSRDSGPRRLVAHAAFMHLGE
ncbi:MAG: hypothetical protein WKG07_37295, partial [Hymenobacter sp.]